jgi:hypothetical protein
MARHLKFYQSADTYTMSPGFQAFSVFNQCFLQEQDYQRMLNNWEDIDEFKTLRDRLERIPADAKQEDGSSLRKFQRDKITKFFQVAHAEHKTMFARWFDPDCLAFLAAFAETELAQIVCRRLLGLEMLRPGDSQKVYTCKNHNRDFPFGLYAKFVAEKIPVDLSRFDRIVHYRDNKDFFENVAKDGFNVWDRANLNTMAARISIL